MKIKTIITITILTLMLIFTSNCEQAIQQPNTQSLQERLIESNEKIQDTEKKVTLIQNKITKDATEIQKDSLDVLDLLLDENEAIPFVENIEDKAKDIIVETRGLDGIKEKLQETRASIIKVKKTTVDYDKYINKLEKTKTKLEEEKKAGLNTLFTWIIGVCLIMAGIIACLSVWFGNIKGGMLTAGCALTVMMLAIAVREYLQWIAFGGAGVILIGISVFIYQNFILQKSNEENVMTQELAKKIMPKETRLQIYGNKDNKGQADLIQSSSTKKIVKNIKKKISPAFDYMRKNTREED